MRCAPPMSPACRPTLKLVGEVAAGRPFDGEVARGRGRAHLHRRRRAARRRHHRDPGEHQARRRSRHRQSPSAAGRHIRRAGLDFKEGQVLLPRGQRLTDRDVMLAAAMSHPTLPVHRRPKVAVLAHRRRTEAAGQRARAGRDRLFQRLCADGAGAQRRRRRDRSRHRAGQGRGDGRRRSARRATQRRRRAGDDRRRLGRRLRSGAARA